MIGRLLSILLLAWMLGFALFSVSLPTPADDRRTDAIVVLTGADGRMQRGLEMLQAGKAERMLVSGVDRRVRSHELAEAYGVSRALFADRIDLGHESVDTRTNAHEAARWVARHHYRSVRLVTTDWHMPRARLDFAAALDPDVVLLADAVPGRPGLMLLVREYNKYVIRRAAALFGI